MLREAYTEEKYSRLNRDDVAYFLNAGDVALSQELQSELQKIWPTMYNIHRSILGHR